MKAYAPKRKKKKNFLLAVGKDIIDESLIISICFYSRILGQTTFCKTGET